MIFLLILSLISVVTVRADHVVFGTKEVPKTHNLLMNCTAKLKNGENFIELNITKDGKPFYSVDNTNKTVLNPGVSLNKTLSRGVFVLGNVTKSVNGNYKCSLSYWSGNATFIIYQHSSSTHHLKIKNNDSKNNKPNKKKDNNGFTLTFKSGTVNMKMSLVPVLPAVVTILVIAAQWLRK